MNPLSDDRGPSMAIPLVMEAVIKYRESLARLWAESDKLGFVSGEFKGFGRLEPEGSVPISVDPLYRLGLSCVPLEKIMVGRADDRYVLIYGADAFAKWPRSDAFFSWPFFPLMGDEGGGTVGLVPDTGQQHLRIAWVADPSLYDDEMPEDEDMIFISKRPIWELPDVAMALLSQDDDRDFLDRLCDLEEQPEA